MDGGSAKQGNFATPAQLEWERKYTWLGDLTAGFGANSLGLRDVPESTDSDRDSWNSDFKAVSADSFLFGQFKLKTDNDITKASRTQVERCNWLND